MIIRDIKDCDIEQILEIYNYYIENTTITFEEQLLSLDEFSNRVHNIQSHFPYIVALENNKVLGYAYLNYYSTRSAYRISADLSIYVDKNERHKSIGKALLDNITDKAKEIGIKNIISIVTSENVNSLNFHIKNGFVECGKLDNCAIKFNRLHGITILKKAI